MKKTTLGVLFGVPIGLIVFFGVLYLMILLVSDPGVRVGFIISAPTDVVSEVLSKRRIPESGVPPSWALSNTLAAKCTEITVYDSKFNPAHKIHFLDCGKGEAAIVFSYSSQRVTYKRDRKNVCPQLLSELTEVIQLIDSPREPEWWLEDTALLPHAVVGCEEFVKEASSSN